MSIVNFYNSFHFESKSFAKIIKSNNFTYFNFIEILDGIINKNKIIKILDYGCGVGTLSCYLGSKGYNVIGTDISSKAIKTAIKSVKNIPSITKCKFVTLRQFHNNYKYDKYDLIICLEVIEHVKNDIDLIHFLKNRLNKNGILMISTPSLNAPLYRMGLLNNFDTKVGHLRRYNEEILRIIFNKLKFRNIQIIKREGIVRNYLYTNKIAGFVLRFIRGPFSNIVMTIDNIFVNLLGESDLIVIAKRP